MGKKSQPLGQLATSVRGLSELRHSGRACVNLPFSMGEGRLLNEQAQVQEAGMFTWDKIFLDWISHIDNHLGVSPGC